jgi:oligopeptide transport system permease protein
MLKFFIRRILGIIPVMWFLATATFFLIRIAPGGPFDQEKKLPEEILRNIEAKYHFDESMTQQYFRYMGGVLTGDLGPSFRYADRNVTDILAETFPVSAALGMAGLVYAICLGVSSGLLAASRPNSWRDYWPMAFSLLGVCLPSFVIGPLLMLLFAVTLGWFNVSGFNEAKDIILPGITLGTAYAAYFSRLTRSGMLEVVRQDYIRTAHAKGLGEFTIIMRHALRGGVLPVVSFLGPAIAAMLTGSLVVETIFNIPGLGRFFVQSALNRDYTMVMGTVLCYGLLIMLMNLAVDLVYAVLDPRVTYD